MFWDKKNKNERLPDLPSSTAQYQQALAESSYAEAPADIHELPSFPDSPLQKGFSQTAIKEAISEESQEASSNRNMPQQEENFMAQESESWTQQKSRIPEPRQSKEHRPVFIRLDKFQAAHSSLETVKAKVSEIEELLKRIREIKSKEDQEIMAWESELENIKGRIQGVLEDIFEKSEY